MSREWYLLESEWRHRDLELRHGVCKELAEHKEEWSARWSSAGCLTQLPAYRSTGEQLQHHWKVWSLLIGSGGGQSSDAWAAQDGWCPGDPGVDLSI